MQFSIPQQELINMVRLYQERPEGADQLIYLQEKGGVNYLLKGLETDPIKGIEKSTVRRRIKQYGRNKQPVKLLRSFLSMVFDALSDFTLKILILAAIVEIILEVALNYSTTSWIEGASILFAVVIITFVTAVNDYQKQKQFEQINTISNSRKSVSVVRSDQIAVIGQKDLVTGDIILIKQGMEILVDGFLVQSNQIYTDQSNMTGQSQPVPKANFEECIRILNNQLKQGKKSDRICLPSSFVLSGTKLVSGEGKMICMVGGRNSSQGKLLELSSVQKTQITPLQLKLQTLAEQIGKFGLYSALIILVILLLRFTAQKIRLKSINYGDASQIIQYFTLAVTVIVVAIPEGLPLAVTLTLAYSVKKMLADNNLVRRLQACQTMGGASQICSDKTGTLTLNKMTVVMWWNQNVKDVIPYSQTPLGSEQLSLQFLQLLLTNIFVNSSAQIRPQNIGSATEIALIRFGQRFGKKYETYRYNAKIFVKIPFSSSRKRMSVIIDLGNMKTLLVKGASEIVVGCCSKWMKSSNGIIQEINEASKKTLNNVITKFAEKGLRTLAFAYKIIDISDNLFSKNSQNVYKIQQSDLILLGIFGVRDLPRLQVPSAIAQCKKAGIRVRMITGDNLLTAISIAKQIGIIEDSRNSICLEGSEFNRITGGIVCKNCRTEKCNCRKQYQEITQFNKNTLERKDVIKNEEQFDRIVKNLDVIARSRPEDKYALVTGLINKGYVVAVTGDGTNDVPALRKADIGFAMGRTGTDIARSSSSIVLLDDNFTSIVKAVLWGRNIYDCVKKFIQFQLTVNIVAVVITLIGAAVLKQQILKPIQLLWINLIMDTLASLALATEVPNISLLDKKPYDRNQYIITNKMKKHILFQTMYQLIILCVLIFLGQRIIPESPDNFDTVLIANGNDFSSKYYQGIVGGTIVSGRMESYNGLQQQYSVILDKYGVYSRHFTFVFNVFVMMQVFNFFNSRRIEDQINIFEKIFKNLQFLTIILIIFLLQIIIVSFGSIAFGLYKYYGLNIVQWILSIIFGIGSLLVGFVAKFINQQWIFRNQQQQEGPLKKFSSLVIKQNQYNKISKRAFFIPIRQSQ